MMIFIRKFCTDGQQIEGMVEGRRLGFSYGAVRMFNKGECRVMDTEKSEQCLILVVLCMICRMMNEVIDDLYDVVQLEDRFHQMCSKRRISFCSQVLGDIISRLLVSTGVKNHSHSVSKIYRDYRLTVKVKHLI